MVTISMMDANNFAESVVLDSALYRLRFNWNDSAKTWTMDVCTNDNADIVRGISVVPNFPLLNTYRRIKTLPPGELMAIVTNTDIKAIGRKDFVSGKAALVYVPKEELRNALESSV
ncbi:phage baseplate plug family protein [Mitsuokella multacida]|uniref:phage baseplate plug family protein n=1 Tax=Mitsuokella multacida TaxID=52226 RepID=UPI003F5EF951